MTDTWDRGEDIPDATTAAEIQAPPQDFSAIASVCGHDPRLMRDLRASVAVIARRTDDPDLRQLALSVLRGQVSVRRLFEHPSFHSMAGASVDRLEEGLERLEDDQREELLAGVGSAITAQDTEFALMEGRPVDGPPPPVRGTTGAGGRSRWA